MSTRPNHVGQSPKEFRYRATTRTRITKLPGFLVGGCKIIHSQGVRATEYPGEKINVRTVQAIEEHILRCLGAAVIMQWNTIPAKLQSGLFDTAGSMGELLRTSELRGQIPGFCTITKTMACVTRPQDK